jgi:hypothetical protein
MARAHDGFGLLAPLRVAALHLRHLLPDSGVDLLMPADWWAKAYPRRSPNVHNASRARARSRVREIHEVSAHRVVRKGSFPVIFVAVLVLPALGMVLFGMDRVEDWLSRPTTPRPARATAGRHLHLVPRPRRGRDGARAQEPTDARRDAA